MTRFRPGRNIAMKVPQRDYDATVRFYVETLGFDVIEQDADGTIIAFGDVRLNIDRVPGQSQTDVWFQVQTDDTGKARSVLASNGVTFCDEVEALPDGFDGFWIAAPNGVVHLVDAADIGGQDG